MLYCKELFQQNMTEHYKKSNWGLNLSTKAKELRHKRARFLIVTMEERDSTASLPSAQGKTEILAFSHFRYELDDDEQPRYPVLYVYELQVKQGFQRHGLGRKLMTIMELMALKNSMEYVMLTVFKHNQTALAFYLDKMKYSIADDSPSKFITNEEDGEVADYEILWKSVSKKNKGKEV
jgi:ribosomal protein S18 acetylase RimI-like enzyme